MRDSVLDRGRLSTRRSIGRRNQVAGVPQYEQLARLGLGEQIRIDARIGASDEKRQRALSVAQALEQLLLGAEHVLLEIGDAADDSRHENTDPL
jgi:hypothetical protein